jgi:hypothetical protein
VQAPGSRLPERRSDRRETSSVERDTMTRSNLQKLLSALVIGFVLIAPAVVLA